MVINGIIDLDNGELLEATGKHRISALDIQGSETAELKLTFYKNGSAVTDNTVVSGAVIDFGVKADADYTGTSYLIYHDTFSASTDGLEYSGTPTWATAEVETALGNESSVKLHGQVKVVISGVTYYSQVFEVEIHNNVIQAAGTTNSVIYPRLIQSTSDPTVNDDSLDGYGVSSLWLNTSSNAVHVLMDNTAGAAVWAGFLGLTNGQLANNLVFNDDLKAVFGTSSDGLEIYHNGSNSYIDDTGTGDLILRANDQLKIQGYSNSHNMAVFNKASSVDLYYNNSKKFETTDTGATVTGKMVISGDLDVDGVTTSFDSTVVNVADPVFGIGGSTPPGSQDNKDRGVSFRYHDGASAKVGFYGWDNSEDSFVFLTDTNDDSTEVFSGTLADLKASKTLLEDGSASAPSYSFASDSNTGIYRASADNLAFSTGGTEAARFDSSGNLQLLNNLTISSTYPRIFLTDTNNNSDYSIINDDGTFSVYDDTNASHLMRLNSTGLGIGGTPTRELEVTGTGNVYARITAPSASDSAALELNNTNLLWSLKADDTDSDAFKIINNNGTALTIDADKNLGIGVTPSEKLTVDGNIRINGDNKELYFSGNQAKFRTSSASSDVIFETGTTELLRLDGSASSINVPDDISVKVGSSGDLTLYSNNANLHYDHYNLDTVFRHFGTDKDFIWYTTTGGTTSELLRLDGSASSVLVGTSSVGNSAFNLEVKSGLAIQDSVGGSQDYHCKLDTSSDTGRLRLTNGVNFGLIMRGVTNQPEIGAYATNGVIKFMGYTNSGGTAGSEVARMDVSTGTFAINQTSPSSTAKLDVNGNIYTSTGSGGILKLYDDTEGRNNRFEAGADADGAFITSTYSSGGSSDLRFIRNSTEKMRINGSGLGIGTSSPQELVHVEEGFILANGSGTSHGFELRRDSNDTFQIRHLGGNFTINNLTDNRKDLSIDGDGNVGISTASPDTTLSVNGGISLKVVTPNNTNRTVQNTDYCILMHSMTASRTVTIPTAQRTEGRILIIKDRDGTAATHNIVIDPESTVTIDGATTYTISTNYQSVKLISDGSNWSVID